MAMLTTGVQNSSKCKVESSELVRAGSSTKFAFVYLFLCFKNMTLWVSTLSTSPWNLLEMQSPVPSQTYQVRFFILTKSLGNFYPN